MSNKYVYAGMQKGVYNENTLLMLGNHKEHNENPDYWNILLAPIQANKEKFTNQKALDFGCGHGRNVIAMLRNNIFHTVDGVDICDHHQPHYYDRIKEANVIGETKYFINNGYDLCDIESEQYMFVMSTIVFQHICVHETRYSLMNEIFRVMKPNGIFSFQMGFGPGHPTTSSYFENVYHAGGTNSEYDVRIENADDLINDLKKIGFKNITFQIRNSFSDRHKEWIYVQCEK